MTTVDVTLSILQKKVCHTVDKTIELFTDFNQHQLSSDGKMDVPAFWNYSTNYFNQDTKIFPLVETPQCTTENFHRNISSYSQCIKLFKETLHRGISQEQGTELNILPNQAEFLPEWQQSRRMS